MTWLFPVQERRIEWALLFILPVVLRGVVELTSGSTVVPNTPTVFMLMIALYQGVLRTFHESLNTGIMTAALGVVVIGSLGLCLPSLTQERGGIGRILRTVVFANAAWIACVAVQMRYDWGPLVLNSRFTGLTANPQAAGIFLALSGVLCLWPAVNDKSFWWRAVSRLVFAVNAVLLAWTGSRTGVLAMALGVAISVRASWRAGLGLAAFSLLLVAAVPHLIKAVGAGSAVERLSSTDTSGRLDSMRRMFEGGLASPIVGTGVDELDASENSFLLAFGAFGLGMLGLVLGQACATMSLCLALSRREYDMRSRSSLSRSLIAFYVMVAFISLFEGILLARFRESLVLLVIMNAVAATLVRQGLRKESRAGVKMARRPVGPVFKQGRSGMAPVVTHPIGLAGIGRTSLRRLARRPSW